MATLRGTQGDDRLFGDAGDDLLIGGDGNDVLKGGDGNDRLEGGAAYDRLFGQAGNDVIIGGDGNDWIQGMAGADILTGGPGADSFLFASLADAGDVITDFSPEEGDGLSFIGELAGAEVRMEETSVSVRPSGAQSFTELATFGDGQQTSDNDPQAVDDDPVEDHQPVEDHEPVEDDEPVDDGDEQPAGNDSSAGGGDGPIDVWYGDTQTFGDPGVPQQWVNILGNVASNGLNSLTWSLNDGPEQALATGRNNTRLPRPGDFNVELDYDQLDPSAVDDVVTIRAAYSNGQAFERDVTIDYEGGQSWPTDYSIDWSQVSDLQDVVQVVDGKWSFDESGVRPEIPGYDRVLAIGEQTWDSYQVELSIHMNSLDTVVAGRRAAIWLGMQWGGHTADPVRGDPDGPHDGWVPGATFMFQRDAAVLRPSEFFLRDVDGDGINDNRAVSADGFGIEDGGTYNFLVRNERVAGDNDLSDGLDRTYSVKVWEAGTPEPADWLLQKTMIDQEPLGSFYLNAHHLDVTFGDITFEEIPRPGLQVSDVLQSEDSLEPLLAANAESASADTPAGGTGNGDGPAGTGPLLEFSNLLAGADDPALTA